MKRRKKTIIQASVSVILLALIFSRFNPSEMWHVAGEAQLQYVLLATLFSPLIFLLKTLKWFFLGKQVSQMSIRNSAMSLLAGMGLGLITPSRVGEITRVLYVDKADKHKLVGLVVIDRLFDLIAIILAGAVALGFAFSVRLGISLIVPSFGLLVLFFIPRLPGRMVDKIAGWPRLPWRNQVRRVASGLLILNGRTLALTFLLAVATFALGTTQFYFLLLSLTDTSPLAAAVSFPILTVAGVIPITIGGFGTREGASVLVLSLYNIAEVVAVDATLMSFILNSLIPGVVGLIVAPVITGKSSSVDSPTAPEV